MPDTETTGSAPTLPSTSRAVPGLQVTKGTGMTTSNTANATKADAATNAVTVCRVIRRPRAAPPIPSPRR